MPEEIKYVFTGDSTDDIDEKHLTPFGIALQTEDDSSENNRSSSYMLLSEGLLRRSVACEPERLLKEHYVFVYGVSVIYVHAVLL